MEKKDAKTGKGAEPVMRAIRWIPKSVRMPTAEDADAQGCVLIWDTNNGVMLTGYRNPYGVDRAPVTHWATPPQGPNRREGTK